MKVLVTGFTAPQVGSARTNGVNHIPGAIVRAVGRLGFVVEHRTVDPGEDLSGYDAVVVCVMSLLSLTTSYALGGLWALARRPGAAIIVDDWQTATIVAQFQTAAERPDYYLGSPKVLSAAKRPGVELVRRRGRVRSAIFGELERLAETWAPHPVAAPVFPWGDVRRLELPTPRPLAFDPSAYAELYDPAARPDAERERRWVLASLFDHSRWLAEQKLAWPVDVYGQKRHGYERLAEAEVVRRYGAAWGVLGHTYDHVESGWWRPRFLHAVHAGAAIYAAKAELDLIARDVFVDAPTLERSTIAELRWFADRQREQILRRLWSRRRFESFVRDNLLGG